MTVLGFATEVLRGGIELPAGLGDLRVGVITVSRHPDEAAQLADLSGLRQAVHLPLQRDEHLFGLIHGSCAVILADGFMQVMEALALGCPALCIQRQSRMNIRLTLLARRFRPFVSTGAAWKCAGAGSASG